MLDLELEGQVAIVTGASAGGALERGPPCSNRVCACSPWPLDRRTAQARERAPDAVRAVPCDMQDAAAVSALPQQALDACRAPRHRGQQRRHRAGGQVRRAVAGGLAAGDGGQRHRADAARAGCRTHDARAGLGQDHQHRLDIRILGKATLVAYSSSKGALLQFTKALAAEWAKSGVQVNAIAPGAFETDAQAACWNRRRC